MARPSRFFGGGISEKKKPPRVARAVAARVRVAPEKDNATLLSRTIARPNRWLLLSIIFTQEIAVSSDVVATHYISTQEALFTQEALLPQVLSGNLVTV